jgi:hypothetical protein
VKSYIPSLLGIFAGGIEGPWLTWALFNLALAFSRRSSSSTISSSIACDCEESTVSLLIGEACSRELYNLLSSVVPRIKVYQVAQSIRNSARLGAAPMIRWAFTPLQNDWIKIAAFPRVFSALVCRTDFPKKLFYYEAIPDSTSWAEIWVSTANRCCAYGPELTSLRQP